MTITVINRYHAFGLIGTALSEMISVFQSSSLKMVPITPNASYTITGCHRIGRPFLKDLRSDLAAFARMFCRADGAAPGCGRTKPISRAKNAMPPSVKTTPTARALFWARGSSVCVPGSAIIVQASLADGGGASDRRSAAARAVWFARRYQRFTTLRGV